ncbi:Pentatricopeptide repeat superfamily protein [Tripterygium wilfordii]|uniref:Pentatricopeptide repeat superfamily protein n=1 Tax=Tripterygium wilfordii TaxID=458696 RepID=A0A7J7BZ61_TRIWF|nr:pentatricopeptide repeat-containing protein At2g03380, mitochondrial [Tripterygium wilfordii]KAF5727163.1 Pentatricopeptide repeat superfamily protein [Tripterygium wilfordii]
MARLLHVLLIHVTKKRQAYVTSRTLSYATHHQFTLNHPHEVTQGTASSVHSIASNPYSAILSLCKNIHSVRKTHALFVVHGLTGNLLCDTKLVSSYGSFGKLDYARQVFDRIPSPDFYSWKVMIRWYFLHDLYWQIIRFYTHMRKCIKEHDNVVFSVVLKACCELRDFVEGRKLHCEIVKAGNPDSFVLTGLVDMYAKCGQIDFSRQVFDEIVDGNVVSWTSMIVGYVQNNCAEEGLVLFNLMRERLVEVNQFTLVSLVTACSKLGALHQGKWVHGYVIKSGFDLNSHLVTALLDMYIKSKETRDAVSVFDELPTADLVSWTAMIVGYTQNGYPEKALKLFIDKKWIGILPNNFTTTGVLSACGQLGNLYLGRSVHSLLIKLGLDDPAVTNALVDMYARCHRIDDARFMFAALSDKDIVTWNSMIYGYSLNGSVYEALQLFHQMRSEAFSPDAVTMVGVFSACAALGSFHIGGSLHAYSIKVGLLSSNVYVGTALLNFYAKCGDAKSARMVFDGMNEKTHITWSAMIGGYGVQGDSSGSLALFSDLLREELKPSEVMFTNILSACRHTGMVGEGWKYFNSMCQDYNFVPTKKHYACMVDLLARAGRLEEAWDFMEKMPVRPDVSFFGAFLHGCTLYSRFDLGAMAIRRMLELHPDEACYYVLMSNLYASDGRWSQVNEMRELMKQRGLSKSPGYSQVGMDIDNGLTFSRVASLA